MGRGEGMTEVSKCGGGREWNRICGAEIAGGCESWGEGEVGEGG